jgi:hypothetical protein
MQMVRRFIFPILAVLLFVTNQAKAQTVSLSNTFVFNANSQITSWDGSDPANPPYPYEMGAVSLNSSFGSGYGSAIDVPFQLGYLNNGYLSPCNPIAFGQKVWTIGNGTHTGDTFTVSGSTTCPYFTGEWGTYENSNNRLDGFSVTATYVRTSHTACRYGRCTTYYTDTLQGGSGTVTDSTIN